MATINTLPKKKSSYGYLWLLSIIILLALGWFSLMKAIDFNQKYEIKKQRTFAMIWHWPLKVELRQDKVVEKIAPFPEFTGEIDSPVKKYIADKFGVYDAKIALGIVQAESGFNEEAWNINTNGTIDVGLWQINSIHFKQPGCSLKEVLDPIRATDCAYNIYKASGNKWNAWVTWNTGAYLGNL